ncbi:MAG: PAS domain S-box protein [Pseudomonadota bacterium]
MRQKSWGINITAIRVTNIMIMLVLALGVFYWVTHSLIHVYLLNQGNLSSFFPDAHETLTRCEALSILVVFGVLVQVFLVQRKRAEAARRRSEERYYHLLDSAQEGVWVVDAEGKTTSVNPRMAEMLGYSVDEMRGKPMAMFLEHRCRASYRRSLESRKPHTKERHYLEFLRKDGSKVYTNLASSPVFETDGSYAGALACVADISDCKKAEDRLREQERFLASIFASTQDGLSILDHRLNIVRLNAAMEKWYSHQAPAVGKKCYEVYHGRSERCDPCPSLRTMLTGKPSSEIFPKIGPSGETIGWLDVYAFPFVDKDSGQTKGCIHYVRDITERKRALEALKESEQRHRALVDNALVGILRMTLDGDILYANRALASMLGFTRPEDMRGLNVSDFNVRRDRARDRWKVLQNHGKISDSEMELRTQQGETRTVLFSATIQGEVAEGMLMDITRHKEAERALQRSEEEYRALVEQAQEGIWRWDAVGRTTFANRRLIEITGYSLDELTNMSFLDLLSEEESHTEAQMFLEAIRPGGCAQHIFTLRCKDGHRVVVSLESCAVMDESSGKFSGAVTCVSDITERKRLADQLMQSEKLAALGELISGVAHELNNPLTTVVGRSQLLALRGLIDGEEKLKRDLKIISQEALRASKIVHNLLTFARRQRPEKRPLNINEILDRTLDLRSYQFRVSNIEIERHFASDLPAIEGDFQQLQQVVLNILNNAEQALTEAGRGGKIRMESRYERSRRRIMVRISDNGPGMVQEVLGRIFDPFFTTKPVGKGTGLGLSLSYGIIKEHGGEIEATSEPGRGTAFVFRLPIATRQMATVEPTAEQPPKADYTLSMLVTDDEESILNLCDEVLSHRGYTVDLARSASEALEKLRGRSFDLALIDVRMPGLSGPEMYRVIKMDKLIEPERVIFMTGDVVGEKTLAFFESEGVSFIAKPFNLQELENLVNRQIRSAMATDCRLTALPPGLAAVGHE